MIILNPEEVTLDVFERKNGLAFCDATFSIPERFMREIIESPEKELFVYRSEGGNLLAARRVMWAPGKFRIDFILNPER